MTLITENAYLVYPLTIMLRLVILLMILSSHRAYRLLMKLLSQMSFRCYYRILFYFCCWSFRDNCLRVGLKTILGLSCLLLMKCSILNFVISFCSWKFVYLIVCCVGLGFDFLGYFVFQFPEIYFICQLFVNFLGQMTVIKLHLINTKSEIKYWNWLFTNYYASSKKLLMDLK